MHNGVEHGHASRSAPTRERHSLVRRCSSSLCVNLRLTSVTHRRKTRKPRLEHAQPCLAHATALPSPLEDERTEQDSLILTGLTRRGFIANTGFSKYKTRLSFQLIGVPHMFHVRHTSYIFLVLAPNIYPYGGTLTKNLYNNTLHHTDCKCSHAMSPNRIGDCVIALCSHLTKESVCCNYFAF